MKKISWILKTIVIILIITIQANIKTYAATEFDGTETGTESGSMTGTNKGTSYTYYNAYNIIANSVYIDTTNYTRISTNTILYQSSIGSNSYYRASKYLIQDNRSGTFYYSDYAPSSTARGNLYTTEPILIPMTTDGTLFTRVQTINNDQTSTGTFSGTFKGTFEGEIILPEENILEYPPAFPTSTGLSYSKRIEDIYLTGYELKSEGVEIKEGYDYGICQIDVKLTFNRSFLGAGNEKSYIGSIYLPIQTGGATTTGNYPINEIFNEENYITSVTNKSRIVNITALSLIETTSAFMNLYFDIYSYTSNDNGKTIEFTINYFTKNNISEITVNKTFTANNSKPYINDTTRILETLENQNNSLESAGGANNELNSQNQLLQSEMQQYINDTDTSTQYGNIKDDLFVLDTGIFTKVASTMTLWSAVVTGLFKAFGDLAIPMNMFLVFVLMSCIIGIVRYIAGNGG